MTDAMELTDKDFNIALKITFSGLKEKKNNK